ncbi:MAG TPA: efflux RND transporter periplasmic adaptor subunit [Candidatus Obscuribacterales bacterium]
MLQEKLKVERLSPSPTGSPRWWLHLALAVLLLAGGFAAVIWADKTWWHAFNKVDMGRDTVEVKRGSIDVRVSATGIIRPYNQVKISPKFTGLLKRLLVQQGDYVSKGQLIALMDDSNLQGQLQAARGAFLVAKANYEKALAGNRPQEVAEAAARLAKAEGQVRHAERAVTRAEAQVKAMTAQVERDETNARRLTDLAAQGAISDQERLNASTAAQMSRAQFQQAQQELAQAQSMLVQSKADLEAARQQYSLMKAGFRTEDVQAARDAVLQAEGNLKYLESQLNDTRIRAPFDGVITQKYTDEGAIVTPTTSAATTSATSSSIVSLAGRLELVAQVAESDIDDIKVGQPVDIVANAYPDRVFHGTVERIAPEAIVTQNVTTFEVHATILDDPQHLLLSGMNVTAEFWAGQKKDALLVPTAAITSNHGKTGVLVPDENQKPRFKQIRVGTTAGTQSEVLEGLKEGDRVFVGLSKAQLEELGYADYSKFTPGGATGSGRGKPGIPRGFGR